MITIGILLALIGAGVLTYALLKYWRQILSFIFEALALGAFAIMIMARKAGMVITSIIDKFGRRRIVSEYMTDVEIDALVDTGVLTQQEADDLKVERDVHKKVECS